MWSRHAIYVHYEEMLRRSAPAEAGPPQALPSAWRRLARLVALWSGVTFYSAVTVGLTGVTVLSLLR